MVGLHVCNLITYKRFLSRFEFCDCQPALAPYDPTVLLSKKKQRIAMDQLSYSQIIGSLIYI
jgi:hypothetical protein